MHSHANTHTLGIREYNSILFYPISCHFSLFFSLAAFPKPNNASQAQVFIFLSSFPCHSVYVHMSLNKPSFHIMCMFIYKVLHPSTYMYNMHCICGIILMEFHLLEPVFCVCVCICERCINTFAHKKFYLFYSVPLNVYNEFVCVFGKFVFHFVCFPVGFIVFASNNWC